MNPGTRPFGVGRTSFPPDGGRSRRGIRGRRMPLPLGVRCRRVLLPLATFFLLPGSFFPARFPVPSPLRAGLARAEVSEDVRWLPKAREIRIPSSAMPDAKTWIEVWEDSLLASAAAPGFSDVRVLGRNGESVPFLLRPPRLEDDHWDLSLELPARWHASRSRDGSWVGWELTLDLGGESPGGHILELPWTSPKAGPIAVAEDGKTPVPCWELGSHRNFRAQTRFFRLGSRFGRIRLRRPDSPAPEEESGRLRVYTPRSTESPRLEVPFRLESEGFTGNRWRTVIKLIGPPRSICGVVCVRSHEMVTPRIGVEVPAGGGAWRHVQPDGPRANPGEPVAGGFRVTWRPVRSDRIRLTVTGADPPNPPISVRAVEFTPARFAFPATAGVSYRLAYGDPQAMARDWGLSVHEPLVERFIRADLGPETANPWYHPEGPGIQWLRRRPAVLTGAMLGALLLLAWIVFRSGSRGAGRTDSEPRV